MPPKCMADRAVSFRRGSETGHDRRVARFARLGSGGRTRGLCRPSSTQRARMCDARAGVRAGLAGRRCQTPRTDLDATASIARVRAVSRAVDFREFLSIRGAERLTDFWTWSYALLVSQFRLAHFVSVHRDAPRIVILFAILSSDRERKDDASSTRGSAASLPQHTRTRPNTRFVVVPTHTRCPARSPSAAASRSSRGRALRARAARSR